MSVTPARPLRAMLLLLAALLSAALMARLGFWQLERAQQKLTAQALLDARAGLPPLTGPELARQRPDQALHRPVALQGRWLAERTVFLDNRPMQGRVGFFVVTPLRLADGAGTVLVQRGWLPRHQIHHDQLPPLVTPSGVVSVTGRLEAAPSRLFELAGSPNGPIRQNLDPAAFSVEISEPLLPFTVIESDAGPTTDGLLRQWPAADLGLQKHYGYAFQWFALCALISGLYVWFQLVRPFLRQRRRA